MGAGALGGATVADGWVRVSRAGREVAARPEAAGRRRRVAEPAHFRRVPGFRRPAGEPGPAPPAAMAESDLPRPLAATLVRSTARRRYRRPTGSQALPLIVALVMCGFLDARRKRRA